MTEIIKKHGVYSYIISTLVLIFDLFFKKICSVNELYDDLALYVFFGLCINLAIVELLKRKYKYKYTIYCFKYYFWVYFALLLILEKIIEIPIIFYYLFILILVTYLTCIINNYIQSKIIK